MGSPVERDDKLVFRVPARLKQALSKAAQEDGRTMSNLAVQILSAWLEQHGYLRAERPTKDGNRR